ncbi:MAG: serine hydrolase domain-containing protein [Bryobacteraceae bacterium]|jgi:CubicO group peptidase (beta-lactamase class C family)
MIRRYAFAVFLCTLPLCAQPSPGLDAKISAAVQAAVKKRGVPSVSVAVVRDGKLAYAGAFGSASLAPRRAATVETRYAIGSISKQFTAAALLLLQEEGKLSLDDKVSKYFPDLTRADQITLRQLLSHTSGYEDYAPQDYIIPAWTKPVTPQQILDGWAKKPLNFDPGTRWQYSNTNYVLAAAIFEKVAGRPLAAFLKEKIFDPLGMQSAGEWPPARPDDAQAYTRYAMGPPRPVQREASGWYSGAAELEMTPSDLAKWDIAFLQKKILSAKSYEEFTREVKLADGGATRYALGLMVRDEDGIPAVEHSGEVSGFLASSTMFPSRNGAVIVVSNEDCIGVVEPVSRQIADLTFGGEPAPAEKLVKEVQAVLEGLQAGRIDRALFTENANSYFSATALQDCKASLGRLGKLESVAATGENLRGGITHRSYRAQFEKKTLNLNIYVTASGKYEQFLVEEQL